MKLLYMSNIGSFILSGILSILLPVKLYLIVVGIIIALDTIYGIVARKKKKQPFSFKMFFDGIIRKSAIYGSAVISIYWMDSVLLNEVMLTLFNIPFLITKFITVAVLSRELISINRNYKIINGYSITENGKSVFGFLKKTHKDITSIKNNDEETKEDK